MTARRRNPLSFVPMLVAFGCLLAAAAASQAQVSSQPPDFSQSTTRMARRATMPSNPLDMGSTETDNPNSRFLHRVNAARQRALVAETNKLLALARALNAGVREDGTVLTPAQRLKMASEIEKLARSVKERMTYAVNGGPEVGVPFHGWLQ